MGYRSIAVVSAIACLGLSSPRSHAEPAAPPAASPAPIGTYQQCVDYPVPGDFLWSRQTIEAFCADAFTPVIGFDEMKRLVESGQGQKLDARLDTLVGAYLAGTLPEGTAFFVYDNFKHNDDATARLIARWLEESPRSAHALVARGLYRLQRGEDARGGAFFKDTPRANIERMEQELVVARADLTKGLERDPRILRAYAALIDVARLAGGDRLLGPMSLTRALKIDPKNFYVRAAYLYLRTPRWAGSFDTMDQFAADAEPWVGANPRLVNLRAIALSHRGFEEYSGKRYEPALDLYERGLVVGPVGEDLFTAGFIAAKLGRHPQAIEYYSQALRFAPRALRLRENRAYSYELLKRYAAAEADLAVVLEDYPDEPYALRESTNLLLAQKDYPAATSKLEQMRKFDPADLWVAERLAWVYIYSKRSFAPAQPLIAQVLDKDPKNGAAWLMRTDLIQNLDGPGLHEAAENFVQFADLSSEEQRLALPKVKAWLATHPKN